MGNIRCGHKKSLFNHEMMRYPHDSFQGSYALSGNALSLTYLDDIIQLYTSLRREYPYIKAHYERIGLIQAQGVSYHLKKT